MQKNPTAERATCELSNEIIGALDKKLLVGGIICDLAKVFDWLIMTLYCSD
jgi:hypothetical protein